MVFHELATNAAKYGALSNGAAGKIDIAWQVDPTPQGDRMRLRWQESGGPPVRPPSQKGFGSGLIEGALAQELDGEVHLDYEPAGVGCQIVMPVSQHMVGWAVNNRFSGRRVLLVEDEPIVAWLLKDMLVDFGCSVVGPAADVNQALAMIDAESIDVAVLDVNLRGQMSYPIADVLVARGVPFVFSTGYDKDRLLDGYRTFPALQKPFHRSDLGDTLAKLLASKERNVESAIATVVDD
jgi:two-component system, chemotaxis family, sensor kinase Cph1